MTRKTAIILFNLGGPDKPESVQPFLFNLFNDKAIIGAPGPIRWCIAKLISTRRAPVAREIYEHLGGKSPLLELTLAQAQKLEESLNVTASQPQDDKTDSPLAGESRPSHDPQEAAQDWVYKAFPCMRYWHPMADEVVQQVQQWGAEEIILLTLYPQFSTTTTGSSLKDWQQAATRHKLQLPTAAIGCYPFQQEFIDAHVTLLMESFHKAAKKGKPRILFSAHGLPKKIVEAGDPYQWQVEQTAAAVVERFREKAELSAQDFESIVCYQSKVGPLEWLKPSTDDEIERACKDGVPIVLVPIAFVSEHSETLVELDIEYREMAEEKGCIAYERVPALGTTPHYVEALAQMCRQAEPQRITSDQGKRLCPAEFGKCVCQ